MQKKFLGARKNNESALIEIIDLFYYIIIINFIIVVVVVANAPNLLTSDGLCIIIMPSDKSFFFTDNIKWSMLFIVII